MQTSGMWLPSVDNWCKKWYCWLWNDLAANTIAHKTKKKIAAIKNFPFSSCLILIWLPMSDQWWTDRPWCTHPVCCSWCTTNLDHSKTMLSPSSIKISFSFVLGYPTSCCPPQSCLVMWRTFWTVPLILTPVMNMLSPTEPFSGKHWWAPIWSQDAVTPAGLRFQPTMQQSHWSFRHHAWINWQENVTEGNPEDSLHPQQCVPWHQGCFCAFVFFIRCALNVPLGLDLGRQPPGKVEKSDKCAAFHSFRFKLTDVYFRQYSSTVRTTYYVQRCRTPMIFVGVKNCGYGLQFHSHFPKNVSRCDGKTWRSSLKLQCIQWSS